VQTSSSCHGQAGRRATDAPPGFVRVAVGLASAPAPSRRCAPTRTDLTRKRRRSRWREAQRAAAGGLRCRFRGAPALDALLLPPTLLDCEGRHRLRKALDSTSPQIYTCGSMTYAAQLPLFRRRGPFPGAGRRPGPNPRVRHRSRADFRGRFPGHVTLKVREGLRSLRDHLRVLKTPLEVKRALNYVLNNARKHLGARAPGVGRVDPASSGPWFQGWREGIIAFARSPAPVARAATWLLRVGWRRHGLLDPSEVPGVRAT
jgi:hypothetical protein